LKVKLITIPSPIAMTNVDEAGRASETFTFRKFVEIAVDNYAPFGKGLVAARQAMKILELAEKANGSLGLEKADYDALAAAVESAPFTARVNRQSIPFHEAVQNAKDAP